jgi:NTP pyrophosphatase (non-canonical NTP hydrolase)
MDNGLVSDEEAFVKLMDEMGAAIYEWAGRKGWNDKPAEFGTRMALVHSEVSEALEAWRDYHDFGVHEEPDAKHPSGIKPCGIPTELADVIIRILHYCHIYGISVGKEIINKMAYNEERPFMHGGKAV